MEKHEEMYFVPMQDESYSTIQLQDADFIFALNGEEKLRIKADGGFVVNGVPVEHDDGRLVYDMFKSFFQGVTGSEPDAD